MRSIICIVCDAAQKSSLFVRLLRYHLSQASGCKYELAKQAVGYRSVISVFIITVSYIVSGCLHTDLQLLADNDRIVIPAAFIVFMSDVPESLVRTSISLLKECTAMRVLGILRLQGVDARFMSLTSTHRPAAEYVFRNTERLSAREVGYFLKEMIDGVTGFSVNSSAGKLSTAALSKGATSCGAVATSRIGAAVQKNVDLWTASDVQEWLRKISFGEATETYVANFARMKVCGNDLRRLTDEMLKRDLHVEIGLHRKRFLAAVSRLLLSQPSPFSGDNPPPVVAVNPLPRNSYSAEAAPSASSLLASSPIAIFEEGIGTFGRGWVKRDGLRTKSKTVHAGKKAKGARRSAAPGAVRRLTSVFCNCMSAPVTPDSNLLCGGGDKGRALLGCGFSELVVPLINSAPCGSGPVKMGQFSPLGEYIETPSADDLLDGGSTGSTEIGLLSGQIIGTNIIMTQGPCCEVSPAGLNRLVSPQDVEIGEIIGYGGCGEIFAGRLRGASVAVKRFLVGHVSNTFAKSVVTEINLMAELRHPNIVLFEGWCERPLMIIMEHCQRGSLWRFLRKRNGQELSTKFIVDSALDIARGMLYLHTRSQPIIHRDLKSPNVLLGDNGALKVSDFGSSRHLSGEIGIPSCCPGTPQWMAPELCRAEVYTEKVDVYSFSIIVWELLTCSPPWEGYMAAQVIYLVSIGKRLFLPDETTRPELTWLLDLLKQCWSEDPALRPPFSTILEIIEQHT
eukprot:Rmarinus@m.23974